MLLGERIKEQRKKLGLSQKELGDKVQVSQRQISKYEKNDSVPPLDQIEKLAEALEVPIGYFVYQSTKMNMHTGKIIEQDKSPYKIKNIANKPPEREFSKQQLELIQITDGLTDAQQTELLGAVKMFLLNI